MLKVNTYFDNKVASIGLQTETLAATVGVMDIGEYQFSTTQHEVMRIIEGQLLVKLDGSENWHTYVSGESFEVPAHSNFELKVAIQTAYFCTYEDK